MRTSPEITQLTEKIDSKERDCQTARDKAHSYDKDVGVLKEDVMQLRKKVISDMDPRQLVQAVENLRRSVKEKKASIVAVDKACKQMAEDTARVGAAM